MFAGSAATSTIARRPRAGPTAPGYVSVSRRPIPSRISSTRTSSRRSTRLVVAYARFWHEFFAFVQNKLDEAGVKAAGDALEIHVDAGKRPDAKRIAAKAAKSLSLAKDIADSGSLTELQEISSLLAGLNC